MAHVAPHKKETVKKLIRWMKDYPIIAVVDVENLPAKQFQDMREKLRSSVVIFMTKKRLMSIAFKEMEKDKKGITSLTDHLRGMPALIFTKDNPFRLFSTLKKNKSSAPAKGGQIAPKDIVVPAGPTGFAPGPIIGELGSIGVKTKVDGGKIAVLNDTQVCKEGQVITDKLAGMLTRLQIFPMEVGLNILAVYEEGLIYTRSVLDVDEDAFRDNVFKACSDALNLAVEIRYAAKETLPLLIAKAHREALSIAKEGGIATKDTIGSLLGIAECQMNAIKDKTNV